MVKPFTSKLPSALAIAKASTVESVLLKILIEASFKDCFAVVSTNMPFNTGLF